MDKNKVKFGLKNVHYALINEEVDTSGNVKITFEKPKRIPYAVSLTSNPQGDKVLVHADDVTIYSEEINNGYEGTLVITTHHDNVAIDIFGNEKDEATGMLFESREDKTKAIALLYEFSGDANKIRYVDYNVMLGRPTHSSETNAEGKTFTNSEYPITASAAIDTGIVRGKAVEGDAAYETFFDEVPVKGTAPTPGA